MKKYVDLTAIVDNEDATSIAAGEFSQWRQDFIRSLEADTENAVPCGDCVACCTSSLFIQIKADEKVALAAIPHELRFAAPNSAAGDFVLGFDESGSCPMFRQGGCSIYQARPGTCRKFDCRVLAAAGVYEGKEEKIIQRAKKWQFTYKTDAARLEHAAVKMVVCFLREQRHFFGGQIPTAAKQLAMVAVKSADALLTVNAEYRRSGLLPTGAEIAAAIKSYNK